MTARRSPGLIVFGTSLGLMLFELCLTRVLSALFYHHTAFLALSLAMLGLGAGAIALRMMPTLAELPPALFALLAAAATTLLPAALAWLQIDQDLLDDLGEMQLVRALALAAILALLPFLFGGAAIALLLREGGPRVGRVYAADLAGAALATLLMVPAMSWLGGPASLAFAGALVAAAAALAGRLRRPALFLLAALLVLVVAAREGAIFEIGLRLRDEDRPPGASLEPKPLFEKWNAFSRVTVLDDAGWDRGLSQKVLERLGGRLPEQREALIDINAFAPIVRFDGDLNRVGHLREAVSNLGLHLVRKRPRVAIIGPGGGKDVLGALLFAPREVVGIEINEILVDDLLRGRFREFAGGLYDRPDVRIIVGDGRSELHRTEGRFDIIIANSVATWAAQSSGAMTLTENHVFTREAFALYRDKLEERGILSISLWDEAEHSVPMKAATTWMAAARDRGAGDVANEIAVVGNYWSEGRWFSTILFKKGGFRPAERSRLAQLARDFGFDLIHVGGHAPDVESAFADLMAAPAARIAASPFDIAPASDDRPFLFYTLRAGDALSLGGTSRHSDNAALRSLAWSFVLVTVLAAALIVVPLVLLRRKGGAPTPRLRDVTYFAALGFGFMAIEIALVQRLQLLLGHPTRSLTVALFALLLASGLGSRLADRHVSPRRVIIGLVLAAALVGYLGIGLAEGLALGLPLVPRIFCALTLVLPLGFLMGLPMPMGLLALPDRHPLAIPFAFGSNAATGVLASVAAILLAVLFGFDVAFGAGLAAYALAAALARSRG